MVEKFTLNIKIVVIEKIRFKAPFDSQGKRRKRK